MLSFWHTTCKSEYLLLILLVQLESLLLLPSLVHMYKAIHHMLVVSDYMPFFQPEIGN